MTILKNKKYNIFLIEFITLFLIFVVTLIPWLEFINTNFNELDEMYEDNKDHYGVLESLMQKIWHFVDEDEGIMELTNNGLELERDDDGFWISDNFDGDMLAEISELWSISLRFSN